jgi:hypothetical protein
MFDLTPRTTLAAIVGGLLGGACFQFALTPLAPAVLPLDPVSTPLAALAGLAGTALLTCVGYVARGENAVTWRAGALAGGIAAAVSAMPFMGMWSAVHAAELAASWPPGSEQIAAVLRLALGATCGSLLAAQFVGHGVGAALARLGALAARPSEVDPRTRASTRLAALLTLVTLVPTAVAVSIAGGSLISSSIASSAVDNGEGVVLVTATMGATVLLPLVAILACVGVLWRTRTWPKSPMTAADVLNGTLLGSAITVPVHALLVQIGMSAAVGAVAVIKPVIEGTAIDTASIAAAAAATMHGTAINATVGVFGWLLFVLPLAGLLKLREGTARADTAPDIEPTVATADPHRARSARAAQQSQNSA